MGRLDGQHSGMTAIRPASLNPMPFSLEWIGRQHDLTSRAIPVNAVPID